MRIQHHQMSLRMCLTNHIIPASVGINTFRTIVLLALTTNCDGGGLVRTQRTHFYPGTNCAAACCGILRHAAACFKPLVGVTYFSKKLERWQNATSNTNPGCLYNIGTAQCLLQLPTANGTPGCLLVPLGLCCPLCSGFNSGLSEDKVKITRACQSTNTTRKKKKRGEIGQPGPLLSLPVGHRVDSSGN